MSWHREVAGALVAKVPEDAMSLRNRLKLALRVADCFGVAQQEDSVISEREMEERDDLGLRVRQQINQ
jgi:hypothetical protein